MRSVVARLILVLALPVLAGAIILSAATAANSVPASHAAKMTASITANALKPAACTFTMADLVVGSGTVSGTTANDLILGSSGSDTLGAGSGGGSDCCKGGAGTDTYKASCKVHF